jgi:hypothetical protein
MSADFVPFLQSIKSHPASAPGQNSAFSPLPQSDAPLGATPPVHTHAPGAEVKVELKRAGDRITQIRIQCRCGELIELDCDYGDQPAG